MSQFTFNTWRDPYDACFSPCSKTQVTLNSGLTVLVGCNGTGKTTMIDNIRDVIKKEKIPVYAYNNLRDGGSTSLSDMIFRGEFEMGALMMSSSEGENICVNIGSIVKNLKKFIKTGDTPKSKRDKQFRNAFSSTKSKEEDTSTNIRFVVLDAVDSGLSVDNVIMLRNIFDDAIKYANEENKEIFIVISANEYELARNTECLDVTNGQYIRFKDYEDYRNFIIKSRQKKEKRDKLAFEKQDKREKKRTERIKTLARKAMKMKMPSYYHNEKDFWISKTRDLCRDADIEYYQVEKIIDDLIKEQN